MQVQMVRVQEPAELALMVPELVQVQREPEQVQVPALIQ